MHEDSKIKNYECMRDQVMIKMNASNQIATNKNPNTIYMGSVSAHALFRRKHPRTFLRENDLPSWANLGA